MPPHWPGLSRSQDNTPTWDRARYVTFEDGVNGVHVEGKLYDARADEAVHHDAFAHAWLSDFDLPFVIHMKHHSEPIRLLLIVTASELDPVSG